ncbi:structural protein P5 [Pseudomonas typographi]|uniref:Structural protein P5 n=3 Tax=Pseudomonas typographi TaxID=2715964 RepID=A0ABR7Z6B4_9PSED|nr:structural protein P5 [Pseudomonas typographi]MBD1590347.1 structural protein P5 [Pseudomonas typographi]MBD1601075.1 structural protein P5 [Pseudomonas typographi]
MTSSPKRGVRNNNPGNIDFNPRNNWQGQLGIEVGVPYPRFARFDTPENGIRALAKLLLAYRGKDGMPGVGAPGIDTVREIISRWAPGGENDTEAYIASVANYLGVKPNDPIDVRLPATLRRLVEAIIAHENGSNPYLASVVDEGVGRALA